jgi:hypothetical protein
VTSAAARTRDGRIVPAKSEESSEGWFLCLVLTRRPAVLAVTAVTVGGRRWRARLAVRRCVIRATAAMEGKRGS